MSEAAFFFSKNVFANTFNLMVERYVVHVWLLTSYMLAGTRQLFAYMHISV
jgi:hypothetical protein